MIILNEPVVQSEPALTTFIVQHFESIGPIVSIQARLNTIKKRYDDMDLSMIHLMLFENLQPAAYSTATEEQLNSIIAIRLDELENLQLIGEYLNELDDEAVNSLADLDLSQKIFRAAARSLGNIIKTRQELHFLTQLFNKYIFFAWYDFENSYPKITSACKTTIKEKLNEIRKLKVEKLKPSYLNYASQLMSIVDMQKVRLQKHIDNITQTREELNLKEQELGQWNKELQYDSVKIEENKLIIAGTHQSLLPIRAAIQRETNIIANNSTELIRLQDPNYRDLNFKCSAGAVYSACTMHPDEKHTFDIITANKINDIKSALAKAQNNLNQLRYKAEIHENQISSKERENNQLIAAYNQKRYSYNTEYQIFIEKSKKFNASHRRKMTETFMEANTAAAHSINAFVQFSYAFK